ncbi:helix-turn-helix domain-containing protein [Halorarum halobium]|uniref:helix-turn-helix domain-containing protein n=1 Tax=Halorarum halobium TaxID=3075121 RepID=UPI0028A7778C|nr:helix-turn-helix domain-containing protein [Halobaculum sp. XH14]
MKYVRLTLRFREDVIHPVHEFIDRSDDVERDLLLHGNTASDGWDTLLFYAEGDADAYASALAAAETIVDFELTPLGESSFYAYIEQEGTAFEAGLFERFSRTGVIVVPPIEFVGGGEANLTVLGDPASLQSAVDDPPDGVDVTVDRIGEYDDRQATFDPGLTSRQREAVEVAVDLGYYAVPSEATAEAVADELGCSAGTAAEHLRKAERNVMAAVADLRSFG